jgi:transcription initiation factor TFIIB
LLVSHSGIRKRNLKRSQGKPVNRTASRDLEKLIMAAIPGAPNDENSTPAEQASQPYRENLSVIVSCPDCKEYPPNLVNEGATLVCASCGLVLEDRVVSMESEWRTFNSDEGKGDDPSRVGEAESELHLGDHLETRILTSQSSSKASRMLAAAQNKQSSEKTNKSLASAFKQVDFWGERAALQKNIRDTAKTYLKQVDDAKAFKGKQQDAVVAGCIFIACRQAQAGRSFNEIHQLTQVPKKEIGRVYKHLEKFLRNAADAKIGRIEAEGGIVNTAAAAYKNTKSTNASDLCMRFVNMLNLPVKVEVIARAIADKIVSINELAGRSPLSNAGACIYFASQFVGLGKSAKEISQVAGVSDTTIKGAYKFLFNERDKLIEEKWSRAPYNGNPKNLPQVQN